LKELVAGPEEGKSGLQGESGDLGKEETLKAEMLK